MTVAAMTDVHRVVTRAHRADVTTIAASRAAMLVHLVAATMIVALLRAATAAQVAAAILVQPRAAKSEACWPTCSTARRSLAAATVRAVMTAHRAVATTTVATSAAMRIRLADAITVVRLRLAAEQDVLRQRSFSQPQPRKQLQLLRQRQRLIHRPQLHQKYAFAELLTSFDSVGRLGLAERRLVIYDAGTLRELKFKSGLSFRVKAAFFVRFPHGPNRRAPFVGLKPASRPHLTQRASDV